MRLGTSDEHKEFVDEIEEIFKRFVEMHVAHTHFKSHGAQSPT
jgi:hypothetical protein